MSEKYLTKAGLSRLVEQLKGKFANFESPHFSGKPTVSTPIFERTTDSKEVINKEYASNLFKQLVSYIKTELNLHVCVKIKPEDWVYTHGVYVSDKLQHLSGATVEHELSLFARIDYSELDPSKAIEAYRNYPIEITQNAQIYLLGEKRPPDDLPIIVDVFASPDFTQIFGGD